MVSEPITEETTEAQTIAEAEQPAGLTVPDVTPDAEPTQDGDAELQPADADKEPGLEPTPDLDKEAEEFAKAELEAKGSEEQPPEPEQSRGIDREAIYRNAETFKASYKTRQERLDALKEKLAEAGYSSLETEAVIKEAKDVLNEHHADSLKLAGAGGYQIGWEDHAGEVWAGIEKALPKESVKVLTEAANKAEGGILPYAEAFKVLAKDRENAGYRRGLQEGLTTGYTKGRTKAAEDAENGKSGANPNGARPDTRTDAEILMDPTTPIETLKAIRARQRGEG